MATGVPGETRPKRSISSVGFMRMQPWETLKPIEPVSGVAWMRMPEAERARARVPRGLVGPGPMVAGMLADQEL